MDLTPAEVEEKRYSKPDGFTGKTPLAMAFRFVEPTWRNYIKYVDMEARDGNADAARYLASYQSLPPRERNAHYPEQLCSFTNVSHKDLISWVTGQAWIEGSTQANLCLSFMRDRVLEKTAQFAMESPDNLGHAKLFMSASGLLPQPGRTSPVTIFNVPTATAAATSASAVKSVSGLRDMDDEIIELSKIMETGQIAKSPAHAPDYEDEDDDDDSDDE